MFHDIETLNRTMLELKFIVSSMLSTYDKSLNRTMLELKYAHPFLLTAAAQISQSYHVGIEIRKTRILHRRRATLNRTVLELKCYGRGG